MVEQNNSFRETTVPVRRTTTLLACCWGSLSAYLLFHHLLVAQDARLCMTALALLAAVWATLERKRWGRLTLLGMSRMALALFTLTLVAVAALGFTALNPSDQYLQHSFRVALGLFADNPLPALLTLVLAFFTGLWLRQPLVVADFERGKRARLAPGQKFIAHTLIACWCLGLLCSALLPLHGQGVRSHSLLQGELHLSSTQADDHNDRASTTIRPTLSADSRSSR